jgi:hypothetical protein
LDSSGIKHISNQNNAEIPVYTKQYATVFKHTITTTNIQSFIQQNNAERASTKQPRNKHSTGSPHEILNAQSGRTAC